MKNALVIICAGLLNPVLAQNWKDMMYDNRYNFYEVCAAAEAYFETHDKDVKGSGWMTYQRWRNFNESKYAPSGDRSQVNPMFAELEYAHFMQVNGIPKAIFGSGWKELGPWSVDSITGHYAAGLGRIEDMYVDPANTDRLYLGSRSGGFWKTLDGGLTWIGTTDFLTASGVNALTARPTNNNDVFINIQNSGNQYSHGIYRSSDAGDNWTLTNFNPGVLGVGGLGSSFQVYELEYHPTIANLVFVGTSQGIYRSDDDLNTFVQLLPAAEIRFLRFHPSNPNIIYAYDNRTANGNRDFVYVSLDAGLTWNLSGQASGNLDASAKIDVSANCADCIYLSSSNGIWKSLNQGATFDFVANPGEGMTAFLVNDQDTSVMIVGSIDPFVTNNGGQSFTQSASWYLGDPMNGSGSLSQNFATTSAYVHADLRVGKSVNGVMYLGTDGYLCKSDDNGDTWSILSDGTAVRENYTLGISQSNHFTTMIGSQDNGTSILGEDGWVEFYGADGMEAIVHPLNPDWMIGSYQYGGRRRTFNGGLTQSGVDPSGESGAGEADWVAPMAYNPNNPFEIYHFSAEVWKSDDFGSSWLQLGAPSTFAGGEIQHAEVAENNSDIIVVTRQSKIARSDDGGLTFTSIPLGLPSYNISDVAIDPNNDSIMVVVYNRYQDDGKKVYITYDAGQAWTNITYNLNDMPIRSVVIDHSSASNIYLGAEIGVFVMPLGGNAWVPYNVDLPNTTIRELEINYGSNTLRAATWGRGMWEYALLDRLDFPAILTTEITDPPTFVQPKEGIDQYVTSMISYEGNLSSVYLEWSNNAPTFGNVITMSNTVDSTWVSDQPIPGFPEGTKMFFKVFAVGALGDTTETYRFTYIVRHNPSIGVNALSQEDLVLYPNPNTGEFSIQLKEPKADVHLKVLSIRGEKVWEAHYQQTDHINCALKLSAGTYFVLLQSEGMNVVKQIMIE